MNLNDLLKKAVKTKTENTNKNIDINKIQLLILLGIRIILIYIFFIFFIGKYIANVLGFTNLYCISIFLGTLSNIYIVFDTFRKYFKKSL